MSRAAAKRAVERLLGRGPLGALGRRRTQGRVLILAWHNIVPEGWVRRGDVSLHLDVGLFRRQLDVIAEFAQVIPLAESLAAPGGRIGRSSVVLTFDDAYRGALTRGLPEIAKRGWTATVFVAPGLLGRPGAWWDRLAPPDGRGWDAARRRHCLEAWQGRDEEIVRSTDPGEIRGPDDPEWSFAAEAELAAALRLPGVTVGAHSWSHPNLAAIGEADLVSELERPRAWLAARFPDRYLPWIAYPYGLMPVGPDFQVPNAGYRAAVRIEGGWWDRSGPLFEIPRLNVAAGLTESGLAVRLAGFLT